jgi:hypothetical protein
MFDPAGLFIELIISGVGVALLTYGKKAERWPHLGTGLLLLIYPYFVANALQMLIVGVLIVIGFLTSLWLGW